MQLAVVLAIGACAGSERLDTSEQAVTCDLGAPDALANACTAAASPQPITAAALGAATAPAVSADATAYGVRLVAGSGGNGGVVTFRAAQSTLYDIYLGTPNAGFRLAAPGGATMSPGCTSAVTASECTYLRKVLTYSLVAGQTYRLEFGPTTASYVRLFVQTRNPAPPTCAAGELGEVAAACADADRGQQVYDIPPLGTNQAPNIALDQVYLMHLPSAGSNSYGGTFAFKPPQDGDYELYLGTPNIPLQITDFFTHVPATADCTRYIPSAECAWFRRGTRYTLSAAISYRVDLGPSVGTSFVRVEFRRSAAAPSRAKLGSPTFYATASSPNSPNSADLDNDGAVDLVVPVADDAAGITEIELLRNTGAGVFETVRTYVWSVPGQNVIADVTGDGLRDIIGNAWDGQGPLNGYYMVGNGGFDFTVSGWGNARDYLPYISGGDFDEDGVIDVVAPWQDSTSIAGPSGFVITLLPSFTVAQTEELFGNGTHQAVAGDFNCDGHQDVAVESRDGQGRMFVGDGTGRVTAAFDFTGFGYELFPVDLDRDGCTDLVGVGQGANAQVRRGSPVGLTAPEPLASGFVSVRGAAAGDFDHDGQLDLAIAGADTETTGAVAVFFGSASGFSPPTVLHVPDTAYAIDPTVSDYSGDGFDDLAVAVQGGLVVFLSTP